MYDVDNVATHQSSVTVRTRTSMTFIQNGYCGVELVSNANDPVVVRTEDGV